MVRQNYKRGNQITAEAMNEIVSNLARRMVGTGINVSKHGSNLLLNLQPMYGGKSAPIKMYQVYSVNDDTLTCKTWDGTTSGTDTFEVAKPVDLRSTGINGLSFTLLKGTFSFSYSDPQTRVSTNAADSSTETQVIVPPYETITPMSIIWVAKPLGGTAVDDSSGDPIQLLDLNIAGRAWAEESP
tara:strand:+ start:9359 stop:9913 length:555 start_codon:yes stop_codon:yes gene_type:complete